MNKDPILSVLVVEGHPLVREALCAMIAGEPGFEVAGQNVTCGNVLDMLLQTKTGTLAFTFQPDVILIGFGEKNDLALATLRELAKIIPDTPILALTSNDAPDRLQEAREAGAKMVLPKSAPGKEILCALRNVKHQPKLVSV